MPASLDSISSVSADAGSSMPLSLDSNPGSSSGLPEGLAPSPSSNLANALDAAPLPIAEAENVRKWNCNFTFGASTRLVSHSQDTLHQLQRSHYGWAYANVFLASSNELVRFFGALTFTIKFNQDWDILHDTDAAQTYERVAYWFVQCVQLKDSAIVIRKLCSALVAYYLRPAVTWDRIVMNLTKRLIKATDQSGNQSDENIANFLHNLDDVQLRSMLWFVETLVHDLAQVDTSNLQGYRYHQKLSSEVEDIVILLHYSMQLSSDNGSRRLQDGLACFQTLALHASAVWARTSVEVVRLQTLLPTAISGLFLPETNVQAIECVTEILQRFSSFLNTYHRRLLSEQLTCGGAQRIVVDMKRGEFSEWSIPFAKLLVAFGDVAVQDIAQAPKDPTMSSVAQELSDLMKCEGFAGIEEVSGLVLPFWVQYVEYLSDTECAYTDKAKPNWSAFARVQVLDIVEACFHKTCWPTRAEEAVWEPGELYSFRLFRKDAQEFFQTAYIYLGVDLFLLFADIALQSQQPHMLHRLEASIFALNGLSESLAVKELKVDGALSRLFASESIFGMENTDQYPLSIRLKRTTVTMITNYTPFFENHPTFLPQMLNFLFNALQDPNLVNVSSIAIKSICSSCRTHLVPELGAFIEQYKMLLTWESVDGDVREKVIGGVAAIIQALPSDDAKYEPLATLIQLTEDDFANALHYLEVNEVSSAQKSTVRALRLFVSIGKALRAPDNITTPTHASRYWSYGNGAALQTIIYQTLARATTLMGWNSDVIGAVCQILRAGYNEIVPGPFNFPTKVTVDFVLASTLGTARLDYIFDTASVMLVKKSDASQIELQNAAFSILNHGKDLLCLVDDVRSRDPDLVASIIQLMEKLVPHHLHSMLKLGPKLNYLFALSLSALAAEQVTLKRAGAHFWASFVQRHEYDGQLATDVYAALNIYGPQLCHVLAMQIGGECARSQLETIAEPLRKLVPAQPQARRWLMEALDRPDFPSSSVGAEEKRLWIQKIYHHHKDAKDAKAQVTPKLSLNAALSLIADRKSIPFTYFCIRDVGNTL
ncbi:MAG: hypothetical protein Q9163_001465 [Psora crenata]